MKKYIAAVSLAISIVVGQAFSQDNTSTSDAPAAKAARVESLRNEKQKRIDQEKIENNKTTTDTNTDTTEPASQDTAQDISDDLENETVSSGNDSPAMKAYREEKRKELRKRNRELKKSNPNFIQEQRERFQEENNK